MSSIIEDLIARKIFNNRGEETIEVDVVTTSGFGRTAAPAGKSRGKAEVVYYPPGGVDDAVKKVDELITAELAGLNADYQEEIDNTLHEIDGTTNFKVIGGNTAFAISIANAEAAANSHNLLLFQFLGGTTATTLPYPLGNCISGGQHARGKSPDIQEYLALPYGAETFLEAVTANAMIHKKIGDALKRKDKTFTAGKSDEGAWIANIDGNDAFEVIAKACEDVGNELDFECGFGVDVAAASFYNSKEQKYEYKTEGVNRDSGEQLEYLKDLIEKYHLTYVEDPFDENDFENTAELTAKTKNCMICGDDLFTTNNERLSQGVKINAGNAIIIKVNQIGTLTDALETIQTAQRNGYSCVMSHRSGDTPDWHIAHLAVAYGCPVIKTGVVEGSRIAKLNELLRIEHFLGSRAKMAELKI
ncbi:MAG: phosphopyruvate hydratase [Candidatus Bathyarchaeota archaeon]|nr:phosphopyruvate hydratase [Candidatus Bathyarchaeota archaeon]